ncbi:hypothetical protein Tco_1307611, partial [Tanacetum coccineum]
VPSSPGYPLRVILTLFATYVDVDIQESVVVLLVLASNVARLVIFSETARRTLVLVRLSHADKKPDASGRVFALTQDQAANTSGTVGTQNITFTSYPKLENKMRKYGRIVERS